MQDLIKQEQFELEVLEKLNSKRLLSGLIFAGGTALRLCYGLNRFSVDLDFWIATKSEPKVLFLKLKNCLREVYEIRDAANKFHTILFEIRAKGYPRSLKIEIRKKPRKIRGETAIAYSRHSNVQVFLKVISLEEAMISKIEAFLNRYEIRDLFDIEFLLKKGVSINASNEELSGIIKGLNSLTKKDYTVKLGSLLEEEQRKYYNEHNFKILKLAINDKLNNI